MVKEGYEAFTAYDEKKHTEKVEEVEPDLIILDLMLPKMDGLEVAREVRKKYANHYGDSKILKLIRF